jgi:hypothetical protein
MTAAAAHLPALPCRYSTCVRLRSLPVTGGGQYLRWMSGSLR